MVSPVTLGTYCAIGRAFTLLAMNKVRLYEELMWDAEVSVWSLLRSLLQ